MTSRNHDPARKQYLNRRSFLKAGAVGAAFPLAALGEGSQQASSSPDSAGARLKQEPLPAIPGLRDLAAEPIVHRLRDQFNPPTIQNEWGYLKVTKSVTGITAISLPPYACCGVPEMTWSPGFLLTCELYLNGRVLLAYPAPGDLVSYTWYPHRVVREARVEGLRFTTQTFMPSKQRAAAISLEVKNESRARRKITLGFDLRAAVTVKRDKPWFTLSPGEADNKIIADEARGCLIFEAQHSRAVSVQGVAPGPMRVDRSRMLVRELTLGPGETQTLHYVNAIADDASAALADYDRMQAEFDRLLKENEEVFTGLIRAAFTPGNSEFSGHLPQLVTRDVALWKLYYMGFLSLLFARRVSPDSAYGPTYLTLGGRVLPTLSFIWDTMLTSLSMALLDPQVLRRMIETWFIQDMHKHLATDYVTGQGVGPWYAANDFGILRCADNYLRATGDLAWLDKNLDGKTVLERLVESALYWKRFDTHGHGLADYGTIENLLEAVSTWLHEVPALNAGNVYGMRFVAALLERRGDSTRAAQLRAEAGELAARINRLLYVPGKGWWRCGYPDGTFVEVRHCYDLICAFDAMAEDLSDAQKKEIAAFFWRELYTPLWMRALSPDDVDATWSIRPDHSWIGAYPAWPSMTAKGLYKAEASGKVAAWLKGVAKVFNQGPIGQAHFIETFFPPVHGGAAKCPEDLPYMTDWSCMSGGSYIDLIIDSIFGADFTLYDGLKVKSRLADFDPAAKLLNVNYQGKSYTITGRGGKEMS